MKKRRTSQREDKDEEYVKDTKDTVVKRMASRKHESLSGNKEKKKKSSKKDEDTELQEKKKENRKRSKKGKDVKEEEDQAQEDVKDEPQIKKKKNGSNKITVDNKLIKENVKGSGSKGKAKQKLNADVEVVNGDVKDKTQDEGKVEVNKESPRKKRKEGVCTFSFYII